MLMETKSLAPTHRNAANTKYKYAFHLIPHIFLFFLPFRTKAANSFLVFTMDKRFLSLRVGFRFPHLLFHSHSRCGNNRSRTCFSIEKKATAPSSASQRIPTINIGISFGFFYFQTCFFFNLDCFATETQVVLKLNKYNVAFDTHETFEWQNHHCSNLSEKNS